MPRFLDTMRKAVPSPARKLFRHTALRLRNTPFQPYLKRKNIEGVVFDFWIGDREGRQWYDLQCTDPDWLEMRFIRDHVISPGDVVLECGGHHGCTAIVLSSWVGPGGTVVTFEPSPANCDIIERNIQLNGIANIHLERKAVGAERGTITIDNASNSSVSPSADGIRVELAPLDDYADLNPTFLKIDVEGFEKQVLQGAGKILSSHPKLAIEIHTDELPKYGASVQDLFDLIDIGSYKTWIQRHNDRPPEPYDFRTPIDARVHLFCVPLRRNGSSGPQI